MSDYQVLARKWRPKSFQDMVGQEHILRMLSNALLQKRIHHAYLLTGTRGVGKTTSARIFAKCLNCETGVTPTPCDQCGNCKAIDAGQFLDLYEIDAASRTKVEDTRDILDNVLYQPSQGRYKIYLIDEVHMLSNHSFNALLKTLEEPPEHVKFILATTDPKKLPVTILSRCLQFHLKRITVEQIAARLKHICSVEHIAHDEASITHLAKAADGSMRDALSLLDQAIAYSEGNLIEESIRNMLGSVSQDDLLPLLNALANKNGKDVFDCIATLSERAPDFAQLLEGLISLFHQLAIAQMVPEAKTADASLSSYLSRFSPEDIQLYYQIALLGRRDLSFTPNPQQGFEMTLLRMLAFKPNATVTETPTNHARIAEKTSAATAPISAKAPPVESAPLAATASASEWRDILPKLELAGMAYALASNCTMESMSGDKITLVLGAKHEPMLNPKLKERFADSLSRYFKKTMQVEFKTTAAEIATPATEAASEQKARLSGATKSTMENPKVKQLVDMYDATVEVTLI
jgi:DNA polymerase-3 subunit gamma/tau